MRKSTLLMLISISNQLLEVGVLCWSVKTVLTVYRKKVANWGLNLREKFLQDCPCDKPTDTILI